MAVVNGPIRQEIGMNWGIGAMSPHSHANATIGRTYGLLSQNLQGGSVPGLTYIGSQGNNYMYNSLTFAENEERSPWEPFHVQHGFKPTDSTVSVFSNCRATAFTLGLREKHWREHVRDMLRGVDPKVTSANLDKIVTEIEARKAAVLLAGMVASGNFGPDYKARFDAVFPDLAARRGLPIYPFFLSGVAGDKALVLPDGLHPNADGAARIASGIAPLVEQSLARLKNARERQAPQ